MQSTPPHTPHLKPILILPSHLCLRSSWAVSRFLVLLANLSNPFRLHHLYLISGLRKYMNRASLFTAEQGSIGSRIVPEENGASQPGLLLAWRCPRQDEKRAFCVSYGSLEGIPRDWRHILRAGKVRTQRSTDFPTWEVLPCYPMGLTVQRTVFSCVRTRRSKHNTINGYYFPFDVISQSLSVLLLL